MNGTAGTPPWARASPAAEATSTSTTPPAGGPTIRSSCVPNTTPSPEELGGVGVVRQRLDGFISADTDHHGGWLTTPLLSFTGSCLQLNIDTGAMGAAFVEIRGADDVPIPGFTLADCEEIGGNFIAQTVYWKGSPDISALAGQPVPPAR